MRIVNVLQYASEGKTRIENVGWVENIKDICVLKNNVFKILKVANDVLPTDKVLAVEGDFALVEVINSDLYMVKPLDTIEKIARKFNITANEIITKNDLKTTRLYIGQVLKVWYDFSINYIWLFKHYFTSPLCSKYIKEIKRSTCN